MKKFKKLLVTLGAFGGIALAGTVASANSVYTVQSGDTLSEIALNNGTTIQDILNINNEITDANVISVGQQIELPVENTTASVQQPVVQAQAIQQEQTQATTPVAQESQPVEQATQQVQQTNIQQATTSNQGGSNLGSAAEQIAQAESGGDYNARNGQYIGKYQLSASYLNGDYSPANQDRVFQQYCNQRYGSVENALSFRQSHGWY